MLQQILWVLITSRKTNLNQSIAPNNGHIVKDKIIETLKIIVLSVRYIFHAVKGSKNYLSGQEVKDDD